MIPCVFVVYVVSRSGCGRSYIELAKREGRQAPTAPKQQLCANVVDAGTQEAMNAKIVLGTSTAFYQLHLPVVARRSVPVYISLISYIIHAGMPHLLFTPGGWMVSFSSLRVGGGHNTDGRCCCDHAMYVYPSTVRMRVIEPPRPILKARLLHNPEGVDAEEAGIEKVSLRAFLGRVGRFLRHLGCRAIEF